MKEGVVYVMGQPHATKPCPFCAGDQIEIHSAHDGSYFAVTCEKCGVEVWGNHYDTNETVKPVEFASVDGILDGLLPGSHIAALSALAAWNFRPAACVANVKEAGVRHVRMSPELQGVALSQSGACSCGTYSVSEVGEAHGPMAAYTEAVLRPTIQGASLVSSVASGDAPQISSEDTHWREQVFEICTDLLGKATQMTPAMMSCAMEGTGNRTRHPNPIDALARLALSPDRKISSEGEEMSNGRSPVRGGQ